MRIFNCNLIWYPSLSSSNSLNCHSNTTQVEKEKSEIAIESESKDFRRRPILPGTEKKRKREKEREGKKKRKKKTQNCQEYLRAELSLINRRARSAHRGKRRRSDRGDARGKRGTRVGEGARSCGTRGKRRAARCRWPPSVKRASRASYLAGPSSRTWILNGARDP